MQYLTIIIFLDVMLVHGLQGLLPGICSRPNSYHHAHDIQPPLHHNCAHHSQDNTIFRLYAYSPTRSDAATTLVSDIADFEQQVQLAPTMETKVQVLKDYSSLKRPYSPSASDRILSLLEQQISSAIPFHLIADYLWSISNLGISNRNSKHRKFISSILYSLSAVSDKLDATAVSRCFVALYRLEVDFTTLTSNEIKTSLLQMITNHSSKFKALQVVNVIFAMSKMKIQFLDLSPATQNGLTKSIMSQQSYIMRQAQLMNMLVYGLAVCNYPLLVAKADFQQCVVEIAYELLQQTVKPTSNTAATSFEMQHLANTIYALGKLGLGHVKYDSYSDGGGLSRLIWQGVSSSMLQRMKEQEASMTVHGYFL